MHRSAPEIRVRSFDRLPISITRNALHKRDWIADRIISNRVKEEERNKGKLLICVN